MRRLFPLHIALLALLSSCRSDGTGQEPMDLLGTVPWQREEWGRCAREIEEHLAPEGRESQMSALDAAFYDILSRDGALADYLQQEKGPLQLLVRGNRYLCLPSTLSLTVKDGASVAGSFSLHLSGSDVNGNASLDEGDQIDLDFTGESAGLQLLASPVQMSGAVASATVRFLSDGYQLAQLTLESADFRFDPESFFLGVTQLALDLPGGISIRGSVEGTRFWNALRGLTDMVPEEQARAFVQEVSAAMKLSVYYADMPDLARAALDVGPYHILNRYDDYWTWSLILHTADGSTLQLRDFFSAQAFSNLLQDSEAFILAWQSLMPHLLS